MGYAIGTVTGGAGDEAHYKVIAAIKTLAEANGWTTLRYDTSTANHELIMRSNGLSGTEQIYVGFRAYQSVASDYYNIDCATFTGFLAENTFNTQPGQRRSGTPCHNNAVTYFLTANPQRIVGCFKVGTPVFTHFYVGKFHPYSRPGEYPAPLFCGGSFDGAAGTRFSETTYQFPYYGYLNITTSFGNAYVRTQSGAWTKYQHWPFNVGDYNNNYQPYSIRPAGNHYQPFPIILYYCDPTTNRGRVYGELDGVYAITGFNNNVENVMQIGGTIVDQTGMSVLQAVDAVRAAGGRAFVILQDGSRTGFQSFVAVEMK